MTSWLHSIRWRIQAWHAVVLLGVILALCAAVYRVAWDNQLRRSDRTIFQAERALVRALIESMHLDPANGPREAFSPAKLLEYLRASPRKLPAAIQPQFSSTEAGFTYFVFYDADGRVLLQSPNAPADLTAGPPNAADFKDDWRTGGGRREILRRSPEGLASVFGADLRPEREELRRFALSLLAAGLGVWLLGLVGGWWLAGRAIRPVQVISATATRIANGNLAERIDVAGSDSELDQLARVLNASFERLHAALEQQKQFTADASHELKTPVTILLSETQRALKRERPAEEYRAVLETCRIAAERMRHLTESLLTLARQEAVGPNGPRERCDLAAIVRDTVDQLRPLAADRQLALEADLPPTPCLGDPSALAILASNLVANALHHHDRAGGTVRVACAPAAGRAVLTVTDDGPGIPAAHLPHLFARFYRADAARTGGSGRSGLGLAIAKSVADNHGGTITVENLPPRGARFTASLPGAA